MEHPDYWLPDPPPCCGCGNDSILTYEGDNYCEECHQDLALPACSTCGSNRRVWEDGDDGTLTCHRFGCNNNKVEKVKK